MPGVALLLLALPEATRTDAKHFAARCKRTQQQQQQQQQQKHS